jgi:mRNA interferase MazF
MRKGEFYRVHQPPGDPKHYRVFVVVSRQALIDARFETVICAPVNTNGSGLSTQVQVGLNEGLKHESWILCDSLTSVRKIALTQYVGALSAERIAEVDRALSMALDLRF